MLNTFCSGVFPEETMDPNRSRILHQLVNTIPSNYTLKEVCLDPYPSRPNVSIDFLQNVVVVEFLNQNNHQLILKPYYDELFEHNCIEG